MEGSGPWPHHVSHLVLRRTTRCSSASSHSESGSPTTWSTKAGSGAPHLKLEVEAVGHHGLFVFFEDVTYTLPRAKSAGGGATILHHVTGHFEPGNMTAVLGHSGSGKSTLLDVLSGRKTCGTLTGSVEYGGQAPTRPLLQRVVGYVEQFDTLVESLTCQEMLLYTAQLKRPRTQPLAEKQAAVDSLLLKLGLTGCAGTQIGSNLKRGISGGQAKRLNIGLSLITDPRVLYLDEPTSGLDSFTAFEVMSVVASLAREGTTVATSIHGPSAACFDLFDQLLVLLNGRLVYLGASGDAAISYFTACCSARQPRVHENVAEWMVETVALADRAAGKHGLAQVYAASYQAEMNTTTCAAFSSAEAARRSKGSQQQLQRVCSLPRTAEDSAAVLCRHCSSSQGSRGRAGGSPTTGSSGCTCVGASSRGSTSRSSGGGEGGMCGLALGCRTYVTPAWWSLLVLLWYRTMRNYCSPAYVLPRLCEKLLFAVVVLSLYHGKGADFSTLNAPVLSSLLFLSVLGPSCGAMIYLPGMAIERALFVRERNDGLYRPLVYLLFKLLDEFVLMVPITAATSAAVFLACKLQGSFLLYWLVHLLTLANGTALAYFLAAVTPTLMVAMPILCFTLILKLLLCGFMIRTVALPKYWAWAVKLNAVHYSWRALMVNQYEGQPTGVGAGLSVLGYFGFEHDDAWQCVEVLVAFFFGWCTLAWLALAYARTHTR